MFILSPLQQEFKHRSKGDERDVWFVYTLLAVITHFTSSRTSNLLRCLQTLFGLSLSQRLFYTFMASSKLPWSCLWTALWFLIPRPTTKGRLLLAWDDFINSRLAKRFSVAHHSLTMLQRPTNPAIPGRSQNVVPIGLLKTVKAHCVCLPLSFLSYEEND